MATTHSNGPNASVQPRARHGSPNYAEGKIVTTTSVSVSEWYTLCQLPDPCYVIGGRISMSIPSGMIGNAVIVLGTAESDATFGTFTVSGSAALAKTAFWGPFTLSSSGGAASATNPQFFPVTATVLSGAATATTSLSIYVILEYVLPGAINTGPGSSGGSQGL